MNKKNGKQYNFRITTLLTAYLLNRISEEEREELMHWVESDDKHRRFFERVRAEESFRQRDTFRKQVDVEKSFEMFVRKTKRSYPANITKRWLPYAAAIAIISTTAMLLMPKSTDETAIVSESHILPGSSKAVLILETGEQIELKNQDSLQLILQDTNKHYNSVRQTAVPYRELRTPRGGEYQLTLSDGTFIYLNSATSIKYPAVFSPGKREIILSGEAYIEVAKDATRPFYVTVGDMTIKVYGTSFNVNTHVPDRIQMALVNGKVGITVKGTEKEYMITPSQLAELNTRTLNMEIRTVDLSPHTAWKDGLFMFDGESLENIMNTLSRWYDVEVSYKYHEVKNLHFTGCIKRYDEINYILNVLSKAVDVKFDCNGRNIVIGR